MKPQDKDLDRLVDRAVDDIRGQEPDPAFVAAAADRVWQRLETLEETAGPGSQTAGRISSCSDFQGLLPDFVAGRLAGPRKLLVHDHLGECITCRRTYKQLQSPAASSDGTSRRGSSRPGWLSTTAWRVAAAAVIFVALVGISFETRVFSFETGGLVRVTSVEGELFRVTEDGNFPLAAGDEILLAKGEGVRTAKGSSAVLSLGDDSLVEMRERSELAVLDRRHLLPGRKTDGVIDLARGSIIVEASDQGSGHLYVDTRDCEVAVQGTVFSVNRGVKGSRVAVIEGEVLVDHGGRRDVLHPGDQTTTHASLSKIPLDQEIAWSHKSHEYIALLKEMRVLGRELDEVLQPGLRYSSDLLDVVPASTAIYVGLPNVSEQLGQAFDIVQQRVAENEVLRNWWDESFVRTGSADDLEEFIGKIRTYGDHLGEEVLLTVQLGARNDESGPLVLARVDSPAALMATVLEDLQHLDGDELPDVAFIEGPLPDAPPLTAAGERPDSYIWIRDDLLAISANYFQLRQFDATLNGSGPALAGSRFHEQLSARYDAGVEWVAAFDLETMIATAADESDLSALESLGLLDVQHVFVERKQLGGHTTNHGVLTFAQPRQRLASWLGEPGPMGTLDYISTEANLAFAFVLKDTDQLVDELFAIISEADPNFEDNLAEFEREAGIDIRRDVAAPLGGEFAMALDGPVLPTPSWKMVVEVYDPARLQQTLEWLVEQVNEKARDSGLPVKGLRIETTEIGDREYFRIQSLDIGMSVHYVFDDGYLIAGPSRALLERALQNKAQGFSLTEAPQFVQLLPSDGRVNFSGIFYHNLAAVLEPLSSALGATTRIADLGIEDQQILSTLASEAKPSLAVVYGESDRIELINTNEGGLLSSSLTQLTGFGGMLSMQQSLVRALEEGTRGSL